MHCCYCGNHKTAAIVQRELFWLSKRKLNEKKNKLFLYNWQRLVSRKFTLALETFIFFK